MRFILSSIFCIFLSTNLCAKESTTESASEVIKSALIEESDFQKLSQQMKKDSLGLVLMFHAEHCPYCALMENDILSPMVKSKEYDKKVLIRKLQIDESRQIKDFTGKIIEPSDFSNRYDATLTPTLVFLDYQGNEKAEKMIGINTVELFGAYLDAEIDKLKTNIDADLAATSTSK